jgi:vancomycin resistance protein YoaR
MPRASSSSSSNPIGSPLLADDGAAQQPPAQSQDQVAAVQARVDQVRDIMQENVTAMVENIDKTTNLEAASANLAAQAQQFQRVSRRARRHFWWQNFRMKLCMALALLAFILIICAWSGAFDHKDEPGHALPSPPPPGLEH